MKFGMFVLLIIGSLLVNTSVAAQVSGTGPPQTSLNAQSGHELQEKNKALARRFYEQVWFSRNLSAVDELFAPTYVAHDIGDRKGVTEPADEQKQIADYFWQNGTMTGKIDYQIAEGDLVATRWQWEFQPTTWSAKVLIGRPHIPIINVFRFRDGKIVEVWNHRHDIDVLETRIFVGGVLVGLGPSLILMAVLFLLWRRLRKQKKAATMRSASA